ncbi:MAG: polyprenyl diphosphate synthase [bacterium]|nr:polyprenyl diphosphate synthase [bacterium]
MKNNQQSTINNQLPKHIAMIMDGNRRWAASQGLGAVDGHRAAAEQAIEPIVERAAELGIKYLTFWAFSTENWKRDKEELEGLFGVFRDVLGKKIDRLHEKGVRVQILGDVTKFPPDIAKKALEGVKMTAQNDKITVNFALNYGGRPEILEAVKQILKDNIPAEGLTEEVFSSYLYTAGMPDPDLVIRTGGEKRISGFMPWQAVYAELYFTPVLWPDFTPLEFDKAIEDFVSRTRRFGGGKFKAYKQKLMIAVGKQLA